MDNLDYLENKDSIIELVVTEGISNYNELDNIPKINNIEVKGNKTSFNYGLQDKLTAGSNITIENNVISASSSIVIQQDYEDLTSKPSINNVELIGDLTTTELGISIPKYTSELINNSGFLIQSDIANKVDKSYVDIRVPAWSESDEGKVLKIINGTPTWVDL